MVIRTRGRDQKDAGEEIDSYNMLMYKKDLNQIRKLCHLDYAKDLL